MTWLKLRLTFLVSICLIQNIFSVVQCSEEEEKEEHLILNVTSKLWAYGRDSVLGGFYNYPEDTFWPPSVNLVGLPGGLPKSAVKSVPKTFRWSKSTIIQSSSDILNNFDLADSDHEHEHWSIENDKLNLLLKIMKVTDRGKYLNIQDHPNIDFPGPVVAVGVVTFGFGTVYEEIIFPHPDLPEKVLQMPMEVGGKKLPFTHVVMGIQWGGIVCIKFETEFDDLTHDDELEWLLSSNEQEGIWEKKQKWRKEQLDKVYQEMRTQMKFLKEENAHQLFQKYFNEKSKQNGIKFKFEILGDVTPPSGGGGAKIETVFDVLKFLNSVPVLLKQFNGGKGHPIEFKVEQAYSILKTMEDVKPQLKISSQRIEL